MNTKPFWQSKTIIFNVLAIIVLVATQFGFADFTLDQHTIDTVLKILAGVTALANVGLRYMTDKPIR